MPIDPGRTSVGNPQCVTGEASVKPYPSTTVAPVSLWNRSAVSRGSGAAPLIHSRKPGGMNKFAMIILQIGIIDIVFSLDSVFTAVGLAKHIEVMVAAIVISVLVMMVVSSSVSRFIDRYPTIKVLALAFLVLVGAALIADSLELDIPQGYLYFAFVFSVAVEWINIRLRRHVK